MRNLKRALSLALASVMLMGMMVVGTSAKGLDDFGDTAEIVNQDAVAVTSEIGIFDGYEDGEFKPENVVTRAEMAVIICKMLYGADVSVSQFAETSVFTDVPAWAEGYVNLCASLGIVAGVGDNKFDPNSTVTTAQAAMMLTKTLGYFQSARDFGDSWVLAATAKATELGLYGDLKLTAAAGLTRDNVAEMVFNALTKAVPVQYNELLGVYYNENQGIIYSLEFNYLQTLGYKNFDLVYKTNEQDMYKRPATTWGFGTYTAKTDAGSTSKLDVLTENGGLIASKVRMLDKDEIITVPNAPTYVYTANTNSEDVYDDLGKSVCDKKNYDWNAYVNGVEQNTVTLPKAQDDTKYLYTANGTVTEIYVDDADRTVNVIEINYYLGQVSKVKSDDNGEYITVKEISKGSKLDEKTFYVEGYTEDDYVIYTVDQNDDDEYVIAEVFQPEVVTGEVARVENDTTTGSTYLRVEGAKHVYSGDHATPDQQQHMVYNLDDVNMKAHPTLNEDYNLYLDPNGYVVGYAKVTEEASQYLYVQDSDEELKDWIAKVVLTDGTNPKVDVKSKYKVPKSSDVSIAWTTNKDNVNGTADKSNIDELIWKYSANDAGVYTLTQVKNQKVLKNAEIHNGKAYITEGKDHFIVDKKTIFVDVEGGKSYIGYDEVPNVENAKIAYALDNKVVDVAFILEGDIYDENSTYFMLSKTTRESLKYDGDNYWEYFNAYINGEKKPVFVEYTALNGGSKLVEGVLYQAKKTNDQGYFTEIEAVGAINNSIEAVADDAFWLTGIDLKEYKFDCDDETIFVLVEKAKNGKYTISDGNLNDMKARDEYVTTALVVEKDDEYAELVYILAVEKAGGIGAGAEGEISYTSAVSSRGNGSIVFEVERPEYVPASATVTVTGDLFVNGVDDNTPITATIAANQNTVRYTTGLTGFDPEDVLTVENINATYSDVKVRYVDENGNAVNVTSATQTMSVTTSQTVSFTVANTDYTAAGNYKITGVNTGTPVTGGPITLDTAVTETVNVDGTDYVTVIIDGLTAAPAAYDVVAPTGKTLADFGVTAATDKTATLTFGGTATGIAPGTIKTITLTLGANPSDNYAYEVTVKGYGTVVLDDNTAQTLKSITVNSDVTIQDSDITVTPIAKLAVVAAETSWTNNTLTVTFNRDVNPTSLDGGVTAGTISSGATVLSIEMGDSANEVVVTFADGLLAVADTINVVAGKIADAAHATNQLGANAVITLAANGTVTVA